MISRVGHKTNYRYIETNLSSWDLHWTIREVLTNCYLSYTYNFMDKMHHQNFIPVFGEKIYYIPKTKNNTGLGISR